MEHSLGVAATGQIMVDMETTPTDLTALVSGRRGQSFAPLDPRLHRFAALDPPLQPLWPVLSPFDKV